MPYSDEVGGGFELRVVLQYMYAQRSTMTFKDIIVSMAYKSQPPLVFPYSVSSIVLSFFDNNSLFALLL
jgi:hypothetical protein